MMTNEKIDIKFVEDYDPNKPENYLLYLGANNLYGWAMSQSPPTRDFKWEDPKFLQLEKLQKIEVVYLNVI